MLERIVILQVAVGLQNQYADCLVSSFEPFSSPEFQEWFQLSKPKLCFSLILAKGYP
jgi:hypothetical protein